MSTVAGTDDSQCRLVRRHSGLTSLRDGGRVLVFYREVDLIAIKAADMNFSDGTEVCRALGVLCGLYRL